jgi:hypothetical protein
VVVSVESDDDEAGFIERLAEAWGLVSIAVPAVADQITGDDGKRSSLPYSAIWRLHVGMGARCLAALQNLQLRETSEGALVLLRNCLEGLAHIEFIKGLPGGKGNAACRALRYELGALQEVRDIIQKVDPGSIDEEYRRRRADLLDTPTGCGCQKPHTNLTRGHVASTLKVLAKREGLRVLEPLYAEASRSTHMFSGNDNLISIAGDGELELSWVPLNRRVTWLIWTMIVFGHAAWASEIVVVGDGGLSTLESSGFADRSQALINDPFLEWVGRVGPGPDNAVTVPSS